MVKETSEQGQALIMFGFLVMALTGFLALTVDVGLMYQKRTSDQAAADSGSLAAVQVLAEGEGGQAAIDAAIAEALSYAGRNGVEAPDLEVTVSIPPTEGAAAGDANCASVETSTKTDAAFSRVFGIDFFPITSRATACTEGGQPFTGLMPWAVKESAIKLDGTPTVMKYDSNNGSNGNFGSLRLFGNGSKNYEDNIKYGVQGSVCAQSQPTCGDPTEETEPGNMIGAARDGVNYRLANTSANCDTYNEVFTAGKEFVPGCDPFNGAPSSLRVLVVPVVQTFCNGHCSVTLKYFALLYLNNLSTCKGNSCEVSGTFVKKIMDPEAELGYTPGDSGSGPPRLVE